MVFFFLKALIEPIILQIQKYIMATQIINIDNISVNVSWKPIKNINIKVKPITGEVSMSCPERVTYQQILSFLEKKLTWIKKKQDKLALLPPGPILQYISGEQHYYLGKFHELQIIESDKIQVLVVDNRLEVYMPPNHTPKQIAMVLEQFYAKALYPVLEELLLKHTPIMNLAMPTFRVKFMKKVWGYCLHKKRAITFNTLLCKKPVECIEQVVVHELSHLFQPNHSKKFYAVLTKYLPDWKERHALLHTFPF